MRAYSPQAPQPHGAGLLHACVSTAREIKTIKTGAMAKRKKPAPRKAKSLTSRGTPRRRKPGSGGGGRGQGRKPSPIKPLLAVETSDTIGETAKPFIAEAIAALVETIRDRGAAASARNAAAKHILDAAKLAEADPTKDGGPAETRDCTDIELARWIVSVLEDAAEAQERADAAKEAGA